MIVKIQCPHCRAKLNVSEKAFGQKAICPACQERFRVPEQIPAVTGEGGSNSESSMAAGAGPPSLPPEQWSGQFPASATLVPPPPVLRPEPAPSSFTPLPGGSVELGASSFPVGGINSAFLRDPKEEMAFAWLILLSLLGWIGIVVLVIFSCGGALLIVGIALLINFLKELFAEAYIKTNAVRVSERQFPQIHQIAQSFAQRLGQPSPTIYVMQENIWNALAMRLAGKRLVILLSGAIDSLLLKGSFTQLAFVVGHELGHHYAGHLNYFRRVTANLGGWFLWVYLWYNRGCELTADRYGLACAGNLSESLRAVANMAAGAQLASEVNIAEAISQWYYHQGEFMVRWRLLYSLYPPLLARMAHLQQVAQQLRIP